MLLTPDFLILNFKGALTHNKRSLKIYSDDIPNPFTTVLHQYGNKTFKDVYDVFYNDEKVGILNTVPRSNIIAEDLIQFQFENHLFYTRTLNDLGQIVHAFVDFFAVRFEGVNRLDLALDKRENRLKYKELYFDLLSGKKLIKGREKSVSAYGKTKKGQGQFNGFTIGERGSSRFLHVYNKSEALRSPKNPKPYIQEYFNNNGLEPHPALDVWRFEYQLNATFFTYLRKLGKPITWQIFELESLIDLIQLAEKNHFEIVKNTGKSETNKEETIVLHNWAKFREKVGAVTTYVISKIKRVFEPSITIQKRLCKSLFRQYYIEPNLAFLYPLIKIVSEYNLIDWFIGKYHFYVHEFEGKEKLRNTFNRYFFIDRFNQLTYTHKY